jgi:tRNA (guanine26-N2/guanine27-N2)-dimethyltransferase
MISMRMDDTPRDDGSILYRKEGRVTVFNPSSGGERGPGTKSPVFYNPAMVQNRDLSVVILQSLIDNDRFPGNGPIRVLDGLTGSGIRAVRFAKEVVSEIRELRLTGVDLKDISIRSSKKLADLNSAEVEFYEADLNSFYGNRRFHYIDIDPFGTPVPFILNALISSVKGGILAVTATDTAALTGSIPRVARRRYGIYSARTHFMQELAVRSLMGYIARTAASLDISVNPIFFYSRDHFIRGYLKVDKGAKRADRTLMDVGWLRYKKPLPPVRSDHPGAVEKDMASGKLIGPIWTGGLSDRSVVEECIETIRRRRMGYLSTITNIEKVLSISLQEDIFPPGGFDLNETASYLKTSPPSVDRVGTSIERIGGKWSRSRFSPTIIKTDVGWDKIIEAFDGGGGK